MTELLDLISLFHPTLSVAQWANDGILALMLSMPNYQAGLAAIAGFNIILITSRPFFRKHAYPLFLTAHIVGIIVSFVAVSRTISVH